MKKLISMHVLILMSLTLGSVSMVQAYNNSPKYASKETKKNNKQPRSMKVLEKDLKKIKQEFKKSGDTQAANEKLDAIPARIKKIIAEMKAHELHGKMWEVHEHTLNRKLREAREYVQHTKKPVLKKASSKKLKQKIKQQ